MSDNNKLITIKPDQIIRIKADVDHGEYKLIFKTDDGYIEFVYKITSKTFEYINVEQLMNNDYTRMNYINKDKNEEQK